MPFHIDTQRLTRLNDFPALVLDLTTNLHNAVEEAQMLLGITHHVRITFHEEELIGFPVSGHAPDAEHMYIGLDPNQLCQLWLPLGLAIHLCMRTFLMPSFRTAFTKATTTKDG